MFPCETSSSRLRLDRASEDLATELIRAYVAFLGISDDEV